MTRPCLIHVTTSDERRAALLQQSQVEKDRLIRHQKMAQMLLTAGEDQRRAMLD